MAFEKFCCAAEVCSIRCANCCY